jgi:branched-chain amino acid aminotransferase
LTPPLTAGLLPGITREFVMEVASDIGVPAREARVMPEDLATMTEVFITGTTREITPVTTIDGRPVGNGRPGPVTGRLLAELRKRVKG